MQKQVENNNNNLRVAGVESLSERLEIGDNFVKHHLHLHHHFDLRLDHANFDLCLIMYFQTIVLFLISRELLIVEILASFGDRRRRR